MGFRYWAWALDDDLNVRAEPGQLVALLHAHGHRTSECGQRCGDRFGDLVERLGHAAVGKRDAVAQEIGAHGDVRAAAETADALPAGHRVGTVTPGLQICRCELGLALSREGRG